MKVAIVCDWLTNMGGGEQVLIELKKIYPEAPIYTSVYDPTHLAPELKNIDVRTSFLQKNKKIIKNHQKYLHLMPTAFESFDFTNYDLVISCNSSCAHGIITSPNTKHICYCYTPMRYGWEFFYQYTNDFNFFKRRIAQYMMNYIRIWDKVSADRVDYFISISEYIKNRVYKHYRRDSEVIYPPVRVEMFRPSTKKDYFLVLSRLVKYKRIDIAIEAFNALNLPLLIIGTGPEEKKLRKMAKNNVHFLGSLKDDEILDYYAGAKAFIFPGEEDFGITILEAQASGTPVIAFNKGGATETINDKTGILFNEQNAISLINAIELFNSMTFNINDLILNAKKYNSENFRSSIKKYIDKVLIEEVKHEDSN
ncbi:MAG: glycosyltransferase [Acholeplasmataceae bacterium]